MMNWEQQYRLKQVARTSLVLWPTISLVVALIVAPIVRWFDEQTSWTVFGFDADGARALLGVLGNSMLTFIVFVVSSTLIVVQLAAVQLTPLDHPEFEIHTGSNECQKTHQTMTAPR